MRNSFFLAPSLLVMCLLFGRSGCIEETPTQLSALVVTGFADIGRGNWGQYRRTNEEYISYFKNLIALPLKVVCFISSEKLQDTVRNMTGYNEVIIYNVSNTYLRWEPTEQRIMESSGFQSLIKHRKNPEYTMPTYNLVNFNKAIFVNWALDKHPHHTHYIWVDFGYFRENHPVPKKVNLSALSDNKIHYGVSANVAPGPVSDSLILHIIRFNMVVVKGSMFTIPKAQVEWFCKAWHDTIKRFHNMNVTDDDQTLVYFIIRAHRERFTLHINNDYFTDFEDYLT